MAHNKSKQHGGDQNITESVQCQPRSLGQGQEQNETRHNKSIMPDAGVLLLATVQKFGREHIPVIRCPFAAADHVWSHPERI